MSGNSFALVVGEEVVVPEVALGSYFPAKRVAEEGGGVKTPMTMRIRRLRKPNTWYFVGLIDEAWPTKVLFVPAGLRPGDTLVIDWVDKNCARAVLKPELDTEPKPDAVA